MFLINVSVQNWDLEFKDILRMNLYLMHVGKLMRVLGRSHPQYYCYNFLQTALRYLKSRETFFELNQNSNLVY